MKVKIILEEAEDLSYWRYNRWVVLDRIPETVEDEDFLNGIAYPGHECWDD